MGLTLRDRREHRWKGGGEDCRGVPDGAASVTAKKGAMPAGMVFAVTLAFVGVAGCKQKQNTAKK